MRLDIFSPLAYPYAIEISAILLALIGFGGRNVFGADYAIGADLSFLAQAEEHGTIFKDGTNAKPALQIFKDHGYNWIRLRLFNSPTNLPNNLDYTIALAKRAHDLKFKFLLDFHYSDTWADPAKQFIPAAWHDFPMLNSSKRSRITRATASPPFATRACCRTWCKSEMKSLPACCGQTANCRDNWDNFADLIKAGIHGVERGSGHQSPPTHHDPHRSRRRPEDAPKYFFDKLNSYGVDYDVIGQSYYPWWHGSLLDLRDNLNFMARTYQKDIIVVETAYCWKPTEYWNKPGPFPKHRKASAIFWTRSTAWCSPRRTIAASESSGGNPPSPGA